MSYTDDIQKLASLFEPKRNNYYYGKMMDVLQFQMEQNYFNRKRWLLNRLGLGQGILCGLNVTLAKDGRHVVVEPGVAVDGFGREIVVPEPITIDPWTLTDEAGRARIRLTGGTHKVTLSLTYAECITDFAPVMVAECNTQEQCAPGTLVESYRLLVSEGRPDLIPFNSRLCRILRSAAPREEQIVRAGKTEKPSTTKAAGSNPLTVVSSEGMQGLIQEEPHNLRERLCKALSSSCTNESQTATVDLAVINLRGETVGTIDPYSYRQQLYSNAMLLEMILCLAENRGTAANGVKSASAATGMPVSATYNPQTENIHFVIPSVTSAEAVTGSPASATFDPATGKIRFVIPPGAAGVSVRSADAVSGSPASASFEPSTGNIHFVIPPGPQGLPGPQGVSVQTVDAETGSPASATFNPTTGNIHFVIPPGPQGIQGVPGESSIDLDLTHIVRISWTHNDPLTQKIIDDFMKGLTVRFDKKVIAWPEIGRGWFIVTVEYPVKPQPGGATPPPHMQAGTIFTQRVLEVENGIKVAPDGLSASFMPDPGFKDTFLQTVDMPSDPSQAPYIVTPILCRVIVKCDYLRDEADKPVDGNFGKFVNGTTPSGDGIPGGDFESWFVLERPHRPEPEEPKPEEPKPEKRTRRLSLTRQKRSS